MMKYPFLLTILMVFALASTPALATQSQETTREYMDDSAITTKVKAALMEESPLKSLEIKVETTNGVVHLSGKADTQANIDRAVQVASKVKGVKSVKNDLRLK